jgi:hypothetical protein
MIVGILVCSLPLGACNPKGRSPVLHSASFSAVDATTGESVNVSLSVSGPKFNGQSPITILELIPGGPYRVSWIGTVDEPGGVTISADGYTSLELPSDYVESSTSFSSTSRSSTDVRKVKLTRITK